MDSRSVNSIRNITYGVVGQLISNLLNFVCRTIFVWAIGVEYLGISGLFSNIFALLSLAELGVGTAISYSLYKPLAYKDFPKIKLLMNLYGKAYRIIAIIILVVGAAFTPFLDFVIKDRPDIPYLELYYLIMLASTVVSYLCSYKRTIILCDQKAYLDSKNRYVFAIIQTCAQIFCLVVFKSYILYLIVAVVCTALSNISITRKANKEYPYLKEPAEGTLDAQTKGEIKKNVLAMICHKVSGVVVYSSDNLIISKYIGLTEVGIYSNYYMIMNVVTTMLGQIFNAIVASVANLNVVVSTQLKREKFKAIYFLNFWITTVCTVCFYALYNMCIQLWLGKDYLFDELTVTVLVIYFFNQSMRHTVGVFKNSAGLYWNDRFKPIFESVINLVASIFLLKYFGVAGVFMGTVVSLMTTSFWVEPYIVYKHVLKEKFGKFLTEYALYTGICLLIVLLTSWSCQWFSAVTWANLFIRLLLCLLVSNAALFLIFFKTKRFRWAMQFGKPILNKFLRRKGNKL